MIEVLTGFPDDVAAFVCHGQVTKTDYESVLIPDVDHRLGRHDKVRIYYETAADFVGVDPGAMWEDMKVGFEHWSRWERLAVVTDLEWIKQTMRIFGFLMPGELRAFPTDEAAAARDWLIR
jgi:hypothetical protein